MRKENESMSLFMVKKEVFEWIANRQKKRREVCGEYHQDTKVYMKLKISVGQGKENDTRDNPSKNARKSA